MHAPSTRRGFLALIGAALSIPARGLAQGARPVLVFAAASLKDALDELAAAWMKRGAGRATISYGASSALARQIEAGAPAELFLSADVEWMDYLAERKLIAPETRRDLVGNRLVLVARKDDPRSFELTPAFDLLSALGGGRLAMAETSGVPAGRYGRAALTALGQWDKVKSRVAQAENVRAALALVARGEAPLGIVYATDALAEPQVRVAATFSATLHPRIVYPAALVAGGGATAREFLAYLQSDEANAAFRRWGFTQATP